MGCPRLTLKCRIKFAEEGGAAGTTAIGVGEHQHVLQELKQGLDLLAFLDIIQPDYQLLQNLLLLFLFAALTGHGAASGDCGELGRLLLSELLGRLRSRPSPRSPAAPRQRRRPPLPSLSPACLASSHRWELRRRGGGKRKPPPRVHDLKIAMGRWERRTPPSWALSGKQFLLRLPPIGRGVIFSPKNEAFNYQNRPATWALGVRVVCLLVIRSSGCQKASWLF